MSEHETTVGDPATPDTGTPASDDAFIRRFQSMIPSDVAASFDSTQLKAIVTVFGARQWRRHAIDRRVVIPFLGRSFCFVALAGGERRSASRRLSDRLLHPLATAGNAALAVVFFVSILLSLLAVLYLLKSLLGIDLLPGTSLGILPAVQEQFELLFR